MGSFFIFWVGLLVSFVVFCFLLFDVFTVVLDEFSEDFICFDDGFLRFIIVLNEFLEGFIMSSDGKEGFLKIGKIAMRSVSDLGCRD